MVLGIVTQSQLECHLKPAGAVWNYVDQFVPYAAAWILMSYCIMFVYGASDGYA